jgi:hypothetical protein
MDVGSRSSPPTCKGTAAAAFLRRFHCVDVALGIDRHTVNAEESARLPSAVSEGVDDLKRVTLHDVHALVLVVREIEEPLLWIFRKPNRPCRAPPQRLPLITASRTNVPPFLNTWMRSLIRSQTYSTVHDIELPGRWSIGVVLERPPRGTEVRQA